MKTQLLWLPKNSLQLNVIKQLFVMLTESEGQEFGQGTTGTAYPCSVMASAGWLKGSGLKSFEGLSSCVLGGWCWFMSGNEPLHVTSAGLVWASSQPEGWVPRVSILGERERTRWMPYHFGCFGLGCHSASWLLLSQLQRPAQVHLVQMGKFWKTCGTGNTAWVIFRKYNLPQWTIHQNSSINILNPPSDLAQLWSHKLVSCRPYIPAVYIFYLDCIRTKFADYLQKSRHFQLSWKISVMSWNSHKPTFARAGYQLLFLNLVCSLHFPCSYRPYRLGVFHAFQPMTLCARSPQMLSLWSLM